MTHVRLTQESVLVLKSERAQEEFYDQSFTLGGSFGLRVNRGGKRSFFLVYSIGGVRRRMTLGSVPLTTLEQAKQRAAEVLRDVVDGKDPAALQKRYRRLGNFEELCRRFLDEHVKGRLKPTTEREYARMIATELIPLWGRMRPSDITARDVTRLLDEIAVQRDAPVMANRVRALLGKLFQFGSRVGAIDENPVRRVSNPHSEARVGRILTFEELDSLLRVLSDLPPIPAGIFRFLVLTGQQPSAVLAMEWRNIQFESWHISDSAPRDASDYPHEIYLVPALLQTLRELKASAGRSRYVFSTGLETHFSHMARITADLNRRLEFEHPFSARDLRRTFQYRLREIGVRPDVIEKIQNRSTSSPKKFRPFEHYDYSSDIREALTSWANRVLPPLPPKKHGKVIQLFR